MLLRSRDLWNACHVTCCYAPEISRMLATLHVGTLPRALECLPRDMLLRCRDLWNACHVTCCYAAEISGMLATLHVATISGACRVTWCYAPEISGMLATLHVATLPRSLECLPRYMLLRSRDLWHACHVTCCYTPEISGMLATLHVATLPRSLECLPRYMLLRCRDLWNACHVICCYAAEISGMLAIQALLMLRGRAANNSSQKLWVPGTKISFYMPKCGNGASSISTRTCSRRLQTCCTSSNEKRMPHFVRSK